MLINNDERFVVPGMGNFVEDLVAEQCIEIPVVTLPLTIGSGMLARHGAPGLMCSFGQHLVADGCGGADQTSCGGGGSVAAAGEA